MSYADVLATGSTAVAVNEQVAQPTVAETSSTPEPIEVESKASEDEESKAQNQLPSPNPSPKADKKQKELNLAPAPVPSVSAWGSAASSRSNSNVSSVDTRHWPSPHEIQNQPQATNGTPKKFVSAKTPKEKWVPFKASVTLPQPGSKKPNNHGQKRNSNKNNNVLSNTNKQVHNDAKKRKNKTEKRSVESKESAPKVDIKTEPVNVPESESKNEQSSKPSSQQQSASKSDSSASTEKSNIQQPHQQNTSQSHNFNNTHNSHHNNNLRYHNSQFQQQPPFIPFQPFPVQGGVFPQQAGTRPFRPYNNNRRYNKYQNNNNNTGYNGSSYRSHNSYGAPFNNNRRNIAHLNKSAEPLFSLLKQMEYYFSIENLLKDIFLRKQMNSQGWLNVTVISGFYRMSVLSAGDFNLIRRALDELNGELLELAEFGNNTLKVRVKENFSNWVLPVDQRDVNGQDESEPVQVIQPAAKDAATPAAPAEAEKETTETVSEEASAPVEEASN